MRSLRPFGFALGWLVLFEALLRLFCAPDPRTVRDPEHPYGCFADDELAQLSAAREADGAGGDGAGGPLDVVLLGDSVLASVENARGQRLVDALQPALQEALAAAGATRPATRVWALAAGGARAIDLYAMLRRVDKALRAGRRGTRGVLVVVSSNLIFFSQRHLQPAMAYPCLAAELEQAGAASGIDDPRLRLGAKAESGLGRLEHRLLKLATAHIYVLQQRRRLAEALFGGPPRLALRERLQELHHRGKHAAPAGGGPDEQALRDRPWTARNLTAAQFAASYDFVPLDSPAAVNFLWTRVLAGWLGAHPDLGAVAVLLPQNHALLGALAEGPAYTAVTDAVAAAFARAGVPLFSYDRDPAIASEHFLDLDHLTAAGNRALAGRLARELAPRLRALAGPAR